MTQVDEKYKHLYGCYPQDDKKNPDDIDWSEEEYNHLRDRRIKHVIQLLKDQGVKLA